MSPKTIFETERLMLREFFLEDAKFIIELVNSPGWLEYIGDRHVATIADAENYLKNGPIKSYAENGFGLWLVSLKDNLAPVGMCGLLKREALEDVDIGFAMLPEYSGAGYGYEAAGATIRFAKHSLGIQKVIAITAPTNTVSINLLNKLGLQFCRTANITGTEPSLIFEPMQSSDDLNDINILTKLFFEAFTNTGGRVPNMKSLYNLFIEKGIVINNTSGTPEVFDLDGFIVPRQEMLSNGSLVDFSEREISNETKIFGNMAQRFSLYEKSGKRNGKYFEGRGMKSIQFVKVMNQWKISSVLWSDEL